MTFSRSVYERLAMGLIAGLVAFGLSYVARPRSFSHSPERLPNGIGTGLATFELHPDAAQISVITRDGTGSREIDLSVVLDGTAMPLSLGREDVQSVPGAVRATLPLPLGDAAATAEVELRTDRAHEAAVLSVKTPAGFAEAGHTLALRAELTSAGQVVFVPGVGQIADRATVNGDALVIDAEPHPIAIAATAGQVIVDATPEDAELPVRPMRVSASTQAAAQGGAELALAFLVADSSQSLWRALAELAGAKTALVTGHVSGTADPSLIFGRDAAGAARVRAHTGAGGVFRMAVPTSVVDWYASVDPGRASSLVPFTPGTVGELVLDISPGGDMHVTIRDADTRRMLTARLLVHGLDGTLDPSFGPDYRASGAGPVIDALRGDVTTPLPSGRYRVAATKGIEWSIDAKLVEISPGKVADVELAPRHVVPTPGVIGCDLHVHARPSFDTPVSPEDRVVSLVAAGIDFAVPTEHNLVGDYTSALETLDLGRELVSVPGVEITTYSKGFGHFGVFPYPVSAEVPPYKHTNLAAVIRAARGGDPSRYFQLNHPRLPKGIGYFNIIGFDPKASRSRVRGRLDFDGIEVYNGYDSESPDRVEQVLRDYWALLGYGWRYTATGSSDSHRIQFHWAGYPRTMVGVDGESEGPSIDPKDVVANVKKGHAVVTSGPMIEFEVGGARPGDEAVTLDEVLHGHVRIRAAPWIDVTRVEVIAGEVGGAAHVVQAFEVVPRPTVIGAEAGSREEAEARTIRLDRDIEVPLGEENGWVQVVARGDRPMDDVLPFMPVPPLAFTNPVYVVRRRVPAPPMPGLAR